jgi:hypothetical protein
MYFFTQCITIVSCVFLQSSSHFVRKVNYASTSDSPVHVTTAKIYNNEMTTHDVKFELNNEVEDPIVISSPISTEMMVEDQPILDIDAMPDTKDDWIRNNMVNFNDVSHSKGNTMVNMKPNGVFFHKN